MSKIAMLSKQVKRELCLILQLYPCASLVAAIGYLNGIDAIRGGGVFAQFFAISLLLTVIGWMMFIINMIKRRFEIWLIRSLLFILSFVTFAYLGSMA